MDISKIKGLKKNESAVLIYLIYNNLMTAKQISRKLEIDIYNLYKILKSLEEKKLIIKQNNEYKTREDIFIK